MPNTDWGARGVVLTTMMDPANVLRRTLPHSTTTRSFATNLVLVLFHLLLTCHQFQRLLAHSRSATAAVADLQKFFHCFIWCKCVYKNTENRAAVSHFLKSPGHVILSSAFWCFLLSIQRKLA